MTLGWPQETPQEREAARQRTGAVLAWEQAHPNAQPSDEMNVDQDAQNLMAQAKNSGGGFSADDVLNFAKGATAPKAQQPTAAPKQPSQPPIPGSGDDFSASDIADWAKTVAASAPKAPPPLIPKEADVFSGARSVFKAPGEFGVNQLTSLGSSIIGGWRGLVTLAMGGTMDDAANAVQEEQKNATYQPESGGVGEKLVQASASKWNPMNWYGMAGKWLGEKTQDVTEAGAQELQQNHPGLANWVRNSLEPAAATTVETAWNAAPLLLLKNAASGGEKTPTPAPQAQPTPPAGGQPTAMRRWLASKGLEIKPFEEGQPTIAASPGSSAEAKAAAGTAQGTAQGTATTPAEPFPNGVPVAGKNAQLSPAEQANRAAVLKRIGLDKVRESAITGDAKAASTDFQTSKLDNAAGNVMRSALDSERQALTQHAENIVQGTGGTIGTDQSALYARGNAIIQPFADLKKYFDQKIKSLYQAADERAQGQPTTLPTFAQTLGDDSLLTNSDRVQLKSAANAYLKKLGMVGEDGSVAGTVAKAETVRKYLNENWSPQNSGFVRALKDALDQDVTSAAGQDIYAQARAVKAMKSAIFENDVTDAQGRVIPNGIGKIVDASGKKLELNAPVDKIPDRIAALSPDELKHVTATLNTVPPEIQPAAQAALGEIKAQFANKVLEAGSKNLGQWNARAVSKVLNQNAEKMSFLFGPDELSKVADLNLAGHILAKDMSYPGASVQQYNLLQRGAMGAIRSGTAATGAVLGGPIGAGVGDWVGSGIASKYAEHAGMKAAQKRIVNLSDIAKEK